MKFLWLFACWLAVLWTLPPQTHLLFFPVIFMVAGIWLKPPPRQVSIVLGIIWGGLILIFQVPPIRQNITFPLAVSLFPEQNIFEPFGLSQADYEIYRLIKGQNATVMDARLNSSAPLRLLNPVIVQNFDQTYFRLDPVNQWRETKNPAFLTEAGIRYLYVDANWIGYLSEAEYNLLYDPQLYTLVWDNGEVYFFEVVTP